MTTWSRAWARRYLGESDGEQGPAGLDISDGRLMVDVGLSTRRHSCGVTATVNLEARTGPPGTPSPTSCPTSGFLSQPGAVRELRKYVMEDPFIYFIVGVMVIVVATQINQALK